MTNNTALKGRIVAAKLVRLGDHPWAWTPISDLAKLLERSPASIWEDYCFDARTEALSENWSGKAWKVALPVGEWNEVWDPKNPSYIISDVWNMKTGERCQIHDLQTEATLLPAGWSKGKNREGAQLEQAIREAIASADSKKFSGKEESDITEAVNAVGTVSNLEVVIEQIRSSPDALQVRRQDYPDTSEIELTFGHNLQRSFETSVELRLRMVLGNARLLNFYIRRSSDY
ncbi:MAG TPA: hypothetical protein V6C81_11865 [Planktothrix sp.]|jgi:hypothetical protein